MKQKEDKDMINPNSPTVNMIMQNSPVPYGAGDFTVGQNNINYTNYGVGYQNYGYGYPQQQQVNYGYQPQMGYPQQQMNYGYQPQPGYPQQTISIGYNGYNGVMPQPMPQPTYVPGVQQGYYGNQFQTYNPWSQYEAQRQYEKQMQEQIRKEIELNKRASRMAHAYIGETVSEEYLESIYNPEVPLMEPEMYEVQRQAMEMQNYVEINYNPDIVRADTAMNQYTSRFVDPNANLQEFFEQVGGILLDEAYRESRSRKRQLNTAYNHEDYVNNVLAKMPDANLEKSNLKSLLFPNLFGDNDVDDNTVHLPSHLRNQKNQEYEQRRRNFLDAMWSRR